MVGSHINGRANANTVAEGIPEQYASYISIWNGSKVPDSKLIGEKVSSEPEVEIESIPSELRLKRKGPQFGAVSGYASSTEVVRTSA